MKQYNNSCELVNTYEVLEYIMGISGLHPHSLNTINEVFDKIASHTNNQTGVILDIGCGSGAGTRKLAEKLSKNVTVIGIDINKRSLDTARANHSKVQNLSFYQGTVDEFHKENPDTKVIGILAVSVSMFLPDVSGFYKTAQNILSPNGLFIDAPFVFASSTASEQFKTKTYSICGCNMKMYTGENLQENLKEAGFINIESEVKEFELMNLKTLSKDYTFKYLLSNFRQNITNPPIALNKNTSWYLFKRTLNIFMFFMKHKSKYGAAIVVGVKGGSNN